MEVRTLASDRIRFRIEEEVLRLEASPSLARSGRSARTLVKDGPLRVALVVLAPGGGIPAHHAEGPVTVQPLRGSLQVDVDGEPHALKVGDLLSLGPGVEHAVHSASGGAFLLTVIAPGGS